MLSIVEALAFDSYIVALQGVSLGLLSLESRETSA